MREIGFDSKCSARDTLRRRTSMILARGAGPLAMRQFQDVNRAFRSRASRISTNWKRACVGPYRVGELLLRGHHRWSEGAQLVHDARQFELTLFRRDVCANLVADVQRGEAEFALIVDLPIMVFAYRLGELGSWTDIPFSWHTQATKAIDRPAASIIVPRGSEPSCGISADVGADRSESVADTCAARDDDVTGLHIRAPASDSSASDANVRFRGMHLQRSRGFILSIPASSSGCAAGFGASERGEMNNARA